MPVTLRSGLTLLLTGDAPFDPEKQVWEAYEHAAAIAAKRPNSCEFVKCLTMVWRSGAPNGFTISRNIGIYPRTTWSTGKIR